MQIVITPKILYSPGIYTLAHYVLIVLTFHFGWRK